MKIEEEKVVPGIAMLVYGIPASQTQKTGCLLSRLGQRTDRLTQATIEVEERTRQVTRQLRTVRAQRFADRAI